MKEQSHKAEMATALRGDFARLRARGVETTLPTPVAVVESPPPPAGRLPRPSTGSTARPPHADQDATANVEGVREVMPAAAAAGREAAAHEIAAQNVADEAAGPVPGPAAEPRTATSWLDRLRGR